MSNITITNPFDGSKITDIPKQTGTDVEQALAQASQTFKDRDNWLPAYKRIEILEKTAELMSNEIEELTLLAASEGGKPYSDSKVEVLRAIQGVKLAIEHIAQIKGEQIPMGLTEGSANRLAFTKREPIGVVSSISAFNHPLNLIVHQTIPAIAVGCPVIIKPSDRTPLSCLRFVEILHEAGLPKQWCQAIVCDNNDAEKLVTDARVNFFSFIGSAKVGWMLRSKLAPGTRCALEHGGAAPVIIDASADMEMAMSSVLKGGFYHAGQVCVSVQRVYAHESICESFANSLASNADELIVGNQLDSKTEVGPLITTGEVDRVAEWVEEAVAKGGKILSGGRRISETCYAPTVILDPPADCKVSQLEIFGPVVCVYSYSDVNDAIARANSLDVAFQAAIYTQGLDVALEVSDKLNATAVMVNDHTAFRVDWMPFGGRNSSGIGMGGIQYTMHEMTQDKMLVIKSNVL
ncbi:MAG: aldehyde dehydrogenase family protein [Cocleimonas sp.]